MFLCSNFIFFVLYLIVGAKMQINNLTEHSQTFGKHKIPRYLYHLTTKENYNNMAKDGFIKISEDVGVETLQGVFMFDLKNFTKRWFHTGLDYIDWTLSLARALILNTLLKSSEIVLLRIPTNNLQPNLLKCRCQDEQGECNITTEGVCATKQKHYTRKKYAIEYIYQKNIPINQVEKIGEINTKLDLQDITNIKNKLKNVNTLQILTDLFKQQPEKKCIELAKNNSSKFRVIS